MSTVYGLTGGVGMGKSTVARLLAKAGLPVLDTDDLAREVVQPGEPALEAIREEFGMEFIGSNGGLDRERMAGRVFDDEAARDKLEAIIHPRVREQWLEAISGWRASGRDGVVVIPLLFEVVAESSFDRVLCVACTADTQRQRLRARSWSDAQIDGRIAAQMPIEEKMERADCVIWNEGAQEVLREQLTRIGVLGTSLP